MSAYYGLLRVQMSKKSIMIREKGTIRLKGKTGGFDSRKMILDVL